MSNYCTVLVLIVLILVGEAISASPADQWEAFLKNPDETNYNELTAIISKEPCVCDWGSKCNDVLLPQYVRVRLFELIRSGEEYPLRLGLNLINCLDGGDLGDFYRASGIYFEIDPNRFFELATSMLPAASIVKIIVALPLYMTDDQIRQIKSLKKRLEILKNVEGDEFTTIKVEATRRLQKEIKLLSE